MPKRIKYLAFSLIPLVLLCVGLEIGARVLYYQQNSGYSLALKHVVRILQIKVAGKRADYRVRQILETAGVPKSEISTTNLGEIWDEYKKLVSSPEGQAVLEYFQTQYEEIFGAFVAEVDGIRARLLVLHVSTDIATRDFFQTLTAKYQVDFLDLSTLLQSYPTEQVRLFPDDGHFSRLGHQLVAAQLAQYLDEHTTYRSPHRFQTHPALLGNLRPNSEEIQNVHAVLPYKVTTNTQGLRMEYDLAFPKTKQRVLILGDSYTFGPFLSNPHVYPNMLDREDPEREIINAGIMGYTIPDELRLFQDKAKYVEPDIVVLQVYSNDVLDLSFLKRQGMGMKDEVSDLEAELLKTFRQRLRQKTSQKL